MGKRKARGAKLNDIYTAEEPDAEEDRNKNARYDRVDNFQYELPADFVDEEIDEDEAFNEEDERLYADFQFKGASSPAASDTEEDPRTYEGLTRDDFSDDDSEADRRYGKPQKRSRAEKQEQDEDSDLEDIFGREDESDGDSESEEDAGVDAAEQERMSAAIQKSLGLPTKKKARKLPDVRDEAVPESEYNLGPGGAQNGEELSVADLIAGLGPQSGKMSKAEKQLAQLAERSKPVEAPLPGPIRARQERKAGYAATKKDVSKWREIVRTNREAPTLVFTAPRNEVSQTNTTNALTAKFKPESKMEAEVAELLKAAGVQSDKAALETEEALALQELNAEEMEKRRNELAKMRSLMFRHEEKARHLAKIKSKDYHRRLKKAARQKAEKAGDVSDKDFIRLQAEKAEFERAKERLTLKHKNTSQWARRALKRGVHLHADGTREAINEQLRLGQELRRKVERIDSTKASDSEDSDNDDSTASSSSEDSDHENDDSAPNKMARKTEVKLRSAAADTLADDDEDEMSKGLFSLPFMRRARKKQKAAAEKEAKQLLAELDGTEAENPQGTIGRKNFGLEGGLQANDASDDESGSEASHSDQDEDAEAKLERLRNSAGKQRRDSGHNASTSQPEIQPAGKPASKKLKTRSKQQQQQDSELAEAWYLGNNVSFTEGPVSIEEQTQVDAADDVSDPSSKSDAGGNELRISAQSPAKHSLLDRHAPPAKQKPSSGKKGRKAEQVSVSIGPTSDSKPAQLGQSEGNHVETERDSFIAADSFEGQKPGYQFTNSSQGTGYYLDSAQSGVGAKSRKGRPESQEREEDREDTVASLATHDGSDAADQNGAGMSQRELIARAFAGDDVAAEFEAEKEAEAEKELPKVEAPSLMPGWGGWASQQKEPAWMQAAKAKAERQKQAARQGRKDAKLEAVIISERWDKKSAKYNAPSLPYPYSSKEAFEGAMRQPLGLEFNTQNSFRALTRPSIIKGAGVIIKPLQFNETVSQEAKKTQRTNPTNRQAVQRVSGGLNMPMRKRKPVQ